MAIQIQCSESDIEQYVFDNLIDYLDLRPLARQYRIPVGIVDILARSRVFPHYYVIEIKKGALDAAAYVQVSRYCAWLNKEYSKYGKRLFFPLLIGEYLDRSLDHLCDYFDESFCASGVNKVQYRLFGIDLEDGFSLNRISVSQKEAKKLYKVNYCHISDCLDDLAMLRRMNNHE